MDRPGGGGDRRWLYRGRAGILKARLKVRGGSIRLAMTTVTIAKKFRRTAASALPLLALAAFVLAAGACFAEDQQPAAGTAPPAAAAPVPPQPPPVDRSGLLHQLKVWWDDSVGWLGKGINDPRGSVQDLGKKSGEAAKGAADAAQGAVKGAVDATKNAATAIVKLPNTRMIDVHERCDTAPNGAPDCATAAANGCRAKGFGGGKPLDVRTAENCDKSALAAGQRPAQHDCPVETTVTRAVCQ
jgi:hypothetical protein